MDLTKNLLYTKHAEEKIQERNINKTLVESTVVKPDVIVDDKFDKTLIHAIKEIDGKHLRVIFRKTREKKILVISAFYDRRLSRSKS